MLTQHDPQSPVASPPATVVLATHAVSQRYRDTSGKWLEALRDIDLTVERGEFVAIIGPSGAGKSTLLNILAGLDTPSSGTVALYGQVTTPRERLGRVGLMPQRDLLLPWRTALDNALVGLEVRGTARKVARERVLALFARFGLAEFAEALPATLSGGMRQRVALIRSALAAGDVLLLDEPFGALDALTRADLHRWLLEVWGALHQSIVLVTHDINEALILADRVIVLSARPAQVRAAISIDLPRPRDVESQSSPAFGALRRRLLDHLEVSR